MSFAEFPYTHDDEIMSFATRQVVLRPTSVIGDVIVTRFSLSGTYKYNVKEGVKGQTE